MNESVMMRVHKKFFDLINFFKEKTQFERVYITKVLADAIILSNSEQDLEKYLKNENYKILIIVNVNSRRKIIDYINKIF